VRSTIACPLVKPDVRMSRIRLSRKLSPPSLRRPQDRLSSAAKPRSNVRTVPNLAGGSTGDSPPSGIPTLGLTVFACGPFAPRSSPADFNLIDSTRRVTLPERGRLMAKLSSAALYPISLSVADYPTNLVLNKTPEGKFQVARVLKAGGPQEREFEVLYTGDDEQGAREFARQEVARESPGLV
jgi:hypothetical protein